MKPMKNILALLLVSHADGSEELYDHSTDPHEHHNLIAETGNRPELRLAVERLSSWIPQKQAGEPDLILAPQDK
jgi:hypothetical protein